MSDKFKVTLVSNDAPDLPDWVPAELADHDIDFVYHECITREDVEKHAGDADIVWLLGGAGESGACLWRGNMQVLKKCGAIVRAGSGTDNVPVDEATTMGIIVANTPHSVAEQVADHTLGLLFSVIQGYEYAEAPFSFAGTNFGASFFMATGFHGFHVIIGTIFLIVCQFRVYAGHFTPRQHFGFEAAAWYWHLVDVVWLFLFVSIYVWGGAGAPVHGG